MIDLGSLVKEFEGILGIAAQVGNRSSQISTSTRERLTVSRNLTLETLAIGTTCTLGHNRTADNQGRHLGLCICLGKCGTQLIYIVAINLDNMPTPRTILVRNVLCVDLLNRCRELYVVGIVVHNEV